MKSSHITCVRVCVVIGAGKDLIGVQNLLKKHQALQAEVSGHEPRIKAVSVKGEAMVEEGTALSLVGFLKPAGLSMVWLSLPLSTSPGHFAGEEVKAKLAELHGRWDVLKSKASQRRQDLEDSLQAQQYFADANEAESWMREKEPIVGSPDYGKDEDSAEVRKIKICQSLEKQLPLSSGDVLKPGLLNWQNQSKYCHDTVLGCDSPAEKRRLKTCSRG